MDVRKSIAYLCVMVFYYTQGCLWSQERPKDFNFVNIKEGISKTAVSTIIQDHYGFMWIGTNGGGLHRYDGIEYISYKHEPRDSVSLSSSMIYSAYLDKTNRLWIGTENGLNVYDRDLNQFRRICITEQGKSNCDSSMAISSIIGDDNGDLLFGVFERGLFKLTLDDFKTHHIANLDTISSGSILNINSLVADSKGTIYAGTNKGLKQYDPTINTLRNSIFEIENKDKTIDEPIQSLLIDNEDNIWIGTVDKGLYQIKRDQNANHIISNFEVTSKRILSLITVGDGTILCGTENDGLIHLSKNGQVFKNYVFDKADKNSIQSNSIWSLFRDKNDRIWMGYYNRGIGVYDRLYDKFKNIESLPHKKNSLEVGSVTGIIEDRLGRLWISMDGGGIDIYTPKNKKITHINNQSQEYLGLDAHDIQTIFMDSQDNIWAGSWNNGIYFLKKGENRFVNFNSENTNGELTSNRILSFAEDTNGRIWIGTFHGGIVSYHPKEGTIRHHKTKEFVENGLHKNDIRKVLVDTNNNIWIGSTNGLYKVSAINKDQYSVMAISPKMFGNFKNTASVKHILSMYESANGSLWIGTKGAGLWKYNSDKETFVSYNDLYDLTEENVSAIIESENRNIWISGNEGLHKIDMITNNITNYTTNDGLLSNDFNFNSVYKDKTGDLYFGGYEGIDYFDPKSIKINTAIPYLCLTDFRLFNQKVVPNAKNSPFQKAISETDSISLTYKQSVFTIEYTGVNYTRPEKNKYAYYLEGLEKSWNYVGNTRSATYTNLDYGNYIFKLKAANNDGIWNETPLKLKITILPPWWKTKWAIVSYAFLFLFVIYMVNQLNQRRIKEKQLIKYEREKRVKEEELHKKKLQFFTNISHEFRTPLTLIINPLIDIINNKKYDLPDEIKEKHHVIHKNTDRLSRLINEVMDFRKLELNKLKVKAQQLDIIQLVNYVVDHFIEEARDKNIDLQVDHDGSELEVWVDKNMIEKVIFNLLSNAFKVVTEKGRIVVTIHIKRDFQEAIADTNAHRDMFEISISDTGPGLEKEQLTKIFERFYQVDTLNKGYYGGTGIGLEVVRSFVQLHKGKVEVDSVLNSGTTFTVILPLGKSHFQEDEVICITNNAKPEVEQMILPSTMDSQKESIKDNDLKKSRLLIVEDNIELRNYLKNELNDVYKVFTASNGDEGLRQAKKEIPDIIITDVIMPKMNGFDFCTKIKEDIKTSHIPLLMLTAKTMQDDRLKGIESGADAYLNKPFDLRVLKSRLKQLLFSRQILFNKYFSAISDNDNNKNTTSLDKEFIQKVLKHINKDISNPDLSVESLALQLHLSRSQFYRKIKTLTGQTASQFLRNIRLQRAKQILEEGQTNISNVCYQVGFSSPSYFTKCFRGHFGILPTEVDTKKT